MTQLLKNKYLHPPQAPPKTAEVTNWTNECKEFISPGPTKDNKEGEHKESIYGRNLEKEAIEALELYNGTWHGRKAGGWKGCNIIGYATCGIRELCAKGEIPLPANKVGQRKFDDEI
jgi:hypothetical protein